MRNELIKSFLIIVCVSFSVVSFLSLWITGIIQLLYWICDDKYILALAIIGIILSGIVIIVLMCACCISAVYRIMRIYSSPVYQNNNITNSDIVNQEERKFDPTSIVVVIQPDNETDTPDCLGKKQKMTLYSSD